MKKLITTAALLILPALTVFSQSIWNRAHLRQVKAELNRPMYVEAYHALIVEADSLLRLPPLSVMMKKTAAPSGDRHDYVSLARYFHPDPSKPGGLPYVERDGITNPEIGDWDRSKLGETADRVTTLSLAWFFSNDERYAAKAAELLKTWFLDPGTRMNPNFEYAQMIPGVNNGKGRCYGVLDGYSFVDMLQGIALLSGSESWTEQLDSELKSWMGRMLEWILTSPQGLEEAKAANNHSTAYDVQAAAIALYVGRDDLARRIVREFAGRRMFPQIAPDGSQPHEMWRTLSFGYSQYNLSHMIDMFAIARNLGEKIDTLKGPEGQTFYKALDYLAGFLGDGKRDWPGKQIDGWEEKQQALVRDLWRVATETDTSRSDYRNLYQQYRIFNPTDRFTLLHYVPDKTDDAFTTASKILHRATELAAISRLKSENASAGRVSPRTVNAGGNIILVEPNDWTSGFFPGELWIMYEFSNDPKWLDCADSATWLIESAKNHSGTHDLGFMIGNSFGKAWELTGDRRYFDVVKRACSTLATRFNPKVGAIRSWDHNSEIWKYPVIIDNMMNLEMLFKIADATGDSSLRDIAVSHADVTMRNHFRADGSSFHVIDYDPSTGKVRMKVTAQGYSDDSFWSRGHGWALYGYTMCFRHTGNRDYLDLAVKVADRYLSLPNMPSDLVPYWDMKAPGTEIADNPGVARDASAAAVIASGLYELAGYVDNERAARYAKYADSILASLTSGYTSDPGKNPAFILEHSTGHHPAGSEIDVPIVYADYYYLEALMRQRKCHH